MVKLEEQTSCQGDRLSKPLAQACNGEHEPLLQDICSTVNGNLSNGGDGPLNGDVTIPIFISSDRLSVKNTAATASLHSSPSHCGLIDASSSSHPSVLPFAASAALAAGSGTHRRSLQVPHQDEVVSIQMTGGGDVHEPRPLSGKEVFDCSWRGMCGPKPKKMAVIVLVVISVWASFILGLNVHKQVSVLKSDLAHMTEKVSSIQQNYLDMQDNANAEIQKLKTIITEIKNKQNSLSNEDRPKGLRGQSVDGHRQRQPKSLKTSEAPSINLVSTPEPTKSSQKDCTTTSGDKCIFPFKYKGETVTGCIQKWSDIKSWCATKLNSNNEYIQFDTSSWGYCNSDCPKN